MHGGCQFFSLTLLVEVDENIFIRWVTLYALVSAWSRGEREKHMRSLASRGQTGRGMAR
jgi:hypothetical protein